jgi:hypothetical protein
MSMSQVKALFNGEKEVRERVHLIIPNGTAEQNETYCSKTHNKKDGLEARWPNTTVVKYGQWAARTGGCVESEPKEKGPTKFEQICALLLGNWTIDDIHEEPQCAHLWATLVRCRRVLYEEQNRLMFKRVPMERNVYVEVIIGPPGCGKSYRIIQRWPTTANKVCYRLLQGNGKWFNEYCQQPVLVIDDFDSWILPSTLLQYTDKYKFLLEYKGGMIPAAWTHVVIISNIPIRQWWGYEGSLQGLPSICQHHQMLSLESRVGANVTVMNGEDMRAILPNMAQPYPAEAGENYRE